MGSVGYRNGIEHDNDRTSWDGSAPRPLAWSAWYPTAEDHTGSIPSGRFFDLGDVQVEAELANGVRLPVVLMSHGTGGSPEGMGWLALKLARAGCVVIGAHHHGNTGREQYRPEGFLCWWERALDLSTLLSRLDIRGPFADRLDLNRVAAVGFSLGGYTVLALAGARGSMERYVQWSSEANLFTGGPREMPDAATHIPNLLKTSEAFRASWARQKDSFLDTRIGAVVALAPPPPVRAFDPLSVGSISVPVTLITAEADTEAPSCECADWLMQQNPRFQRISVGDSVGHYTFLGFPSGEVLEDEAFLFADAAGVSRADVHERVATSTLLALRALNP